MLTYPQIDPVAISFGPISVHWYGIMYIIAFGGAWVLATYRAARVADPWTAVQICDLIFFGALIMFPWLSIISPRPVVPDPS